MKINWALLAAVCTTLAGVAGEIVTPLAGTAIANETRNILEGLSAVLLVLGGGGATYVAVTAAKAKALMKLGVKP